jgi:hypothetical protein
MKTDLGFFLFSVIAEAVDNRMMDGQMCSEEDMEMWCPETSSPTPYAAIRQEEILLEILLK